jgi:acetoacetyl-CoA synthetase
MRVQVYHDAGHPLREKQGELICTAPFPSMPVGFWNDPGGSRYRAAYFDRFPKVWCYGDFAILTQRGALVILGRSVAVRNPGGCLRDAGLSRRCQGRSCA